jgi:hypothetical protein
VKPFRLSFGKFKNTELTKVPSSYLNWMIVQGHQFAFKAEEELARRGTPCNKTVDIAPHAVDRASQRMMHLWISTQETGEGIYSWLLRRSSAALLAMSSQEKKDRKKVEHDGVIFVLDFNTVIPILVSVWLAGGKDES